MYNSTLNGNGIIISLDGNIGAGKSSILKELKNIGYIIFPEDIDTWQPILDNFYNDPKRWSFTLQIAIINNLRDQYNQINELLQTNSFVFIEKSSHIQQNLCGNFQE